jgi:DNA-binding NarL/FixJ family response regulator
MRVVIADDHKLVRDGIKWMLASEPEIEIVGEASDGAALLSVLEEVETDVVLLDIRMPQVSGIEVLAELRDREGSPPVVILSMYHEPALVQEAIALGAAGFLLKSAGRDELIEAITTVAGGGSYLQVSLARSLVARFADAKTVSPSLLTAGEREVLRLVADGLGNREIAVRVGRTEVGVRTLLHSTFKRLGVKSRSEAVAAALRLGIFD